MTRPDHSRPSSNRQKILGATWSLASLVVCLSALRGTQTTHSFVHVQFLGRYIGNLIGSIGWGSCIRLRSVMQVYRNPAEPSHPHTFTECSAWTWTALLHMIEHRTGDLVPFLPVFKACVHHESPPEYPFRRVGFVRPAQQGTQHRPRITRLAAAFSPAILS